MKFVAAHTKLSRIQRRKKAAKKQRYSNFYKKFPAKKLIKFLVILLPFLIFLAIFWTIPKLIKVNKIACSSQFGPCNSVLQTKLDSLPNSDYSKAILGIRSILKNDYLVSKYSTRLNLPESIEVNVIERKPQVAVVAQNDTTRFAYIDETGLVIAISQKTSLPILLVKQDMVLSPGDKLDNKLSFASLALFQNYQINNIKLGIVYSDYLEVETREGIKVIFPLFGDLDVLFGSMSLILSRLNSSTNNTRIEEVLNFKPTVVDLRFKNPVLK